LLFTYYKEDDLIKMIEKDYDIIRIERYKEDKKDDSILLIIKSKE
jgi:hypothetical protein